MQIRKLEDPFCLAKRVVSQNLQLDNKVLQMNFCLRKAILQDDFMVPIAGTTSGYRADTTLLRADATLLTADYAL